MSSKFRRLAPDFFVSPQIGPEEIEAAKALGVRRVINNRPDQEEPGQPAGKAVEEAARKAGLAYVAIPVRGMEMGAAELDAFDRAMAAGEGPTLAFCRSGTRSTVLRALARARAGESIETLIAEAAAAGYDLSGIAGRLASVRK